VVFGIGTSMSDTEFGVPLRGKTLIQNTASEREFGKDYPLACALLGDAKLVLRQVIDEVSLQGARRANVVHAEIARAKESWLSEWMPRFTSDERPMSPYRVIWELMRALDRTRTIVTHDSGNPRDQIVPFWESVIPHGYIGWGKSTQLGYSLGLAMGARLAAPDKQVVQFMGDAAFGMCGMDVETAARERIPILTVIVNNSALGGYEKYMPIATERYGTKFLTGSYAGVAAALGAYGERVEQPSEIVPAIRRAEAALADGKPAVLEMITREEPNFSKHW
jgi:thiamine pyrophosphate-dependent acetolactate synthase large subunit-like protein